MKNHFAFAVLAAVALQSVAAVPAAFADEARRDRHEARHEERRAADSRADAIKNDLNGHPIRAELNARHADHEEARAEKHAVESHFDR
jgi:hypothetical protein